MTISLEKWSSTDTKLVLLDTAKIEVYNDMLKHCDIPIAIGAVSP